MVFVVDDFDLPSKWVTTVSGTGNIINLQPKTFQMSLPNAGDTAQLATANLIHVSELSDVKIRADRAVAASLIGIDHPAHLGYGHLITRDAIYGVVCWVGGGAKFIMPDPAEPRHVSELGLQLVKLDTPANPNNPWMVKYLYNTQLIFEAPKIQYGYTPMEDFLVLIRADATRINKVVTGTNTFMTVGYIPPIPKHVLTVTSTPLGIPFERNP